MLEIEDFWHARWEYVYGNLVTLVLQNDLGAGFFDVENANVNLSDLSCLFVSAPGPGMWRVTAVPYQDTLEGPEKISEAVPGE